MKKSKIKIDEFGQLPLGLMCYIEDEFFGEKVFVDIEYLIRILKRLSQLKKLDPDQLAEADIPQTLNYILSIISPKVLKLYETSKKNRNRRL